MLEPVVSTRAANKEKRRRRILDEAREIIATQGYDALNTRDLAKAADITTPTLYNLVGTKEEILTAVSLESMDQLEAIMSNVEEDDAMSYFEGLITESRKLIEAEEGFYRGSLLAMFRLSAAQKPDSPEQRFARRGSEIAAQGCRIAQQQGLLLGNVPTEVLGTQMYTAYSAPWREWTYRRLSREEFLHQALQGFYIVLCSDASTTFLRTLRRKLAALRIDDTRPAKKKRKRA